jgi:uncharacterized membrane protein
MPTFRLAELHPIIVHFPIALLIVSVACDFAAVFLRRAGLTTTATWTLVFGVPGAAAALLSGWLSEHDVSAALAGSVLHLHKVCAVLTTVLFGTLLALRLFWLMPRILWWAANIFPVPLPALAGASERLEGAVPILYLKPLPRAIIALYLVFSVIGLALLAVTGYLGGALVYDHGVGMPAAPTP